MCEIVYFVLKRKVVPLNLATFDCQNMVLLFSDISKNISGHSGFFLRGYQVKFFLFLTL